MVVKELKDLISGVEISADNKTLSVSRLDGTSDSYTFTEQLDMDNIIIDNGIYFQDIIDESKDGIYISNNNTVSVVHDGSLYRKGIYSFEDRMSLETSDFVQVVNGREVYSESQNFSSTILSGSEIEIASYLGDPQAIFTSPTSVSLQTSLDTINKYQDENFAIMDEMFVGTRYFHWFRSSFYISRTSIICHSTDSKLYDVNPITGARKLLRENVNSYSIHGSMLAWQNSNTVTVERIIGGGKVLKSIPEAVIELQEEPELIALCDDLFILSKVADNLVLSDMIGNVVTSVSGFLDVKAIAVDKRFKFIYAQNGKMFVRPLYDTIKPITSFLIQEDSRCPLAYSIGMTYNRTPSVSSYLNFGHGIIDASMSSAMELVTIGDDNKIRKHIFIGNEPSNGVQTTVVSADTLLDPLSIISIGAYAYVTTLGSNNILMAYNNSTLLREPTQDVDLSVAIVGDNIHSIAKNSNGTISVLDSSNKVTIINSILSKVVLSGFYATTYLGPQSKICSSNGTDILASHVTSHGTNIHTVFAQNGQADDIYSLVTSTHSVPMITGMRLFTLSEDGSRLNEYLQTTEIKVIQ